MIQYHHNRNGGNMRNKIYFGSLFLILGIGLYFGIGNYFYDKAINAKTSKSFLSVSSKVKKITTEHKKVELERKEQNHTFLLQAIPEETSIISSDKHSLKLHAIRYKQESLSHKWAIVVHGYGGSSKDMTTWNRNFYTQGYNVLAPDLRGHGQSGGNYIGMGWDDRKDILGWINEIVSQDYQAEIVLFGISMGGATVMNASGEELPSQVKAIIEDCGFTSTAEIFGYQLKKLYHLPSFPVMNAANTVTKIRAGFDIFKSSALNQVRKNQTPMLFIHGKEDDFVPFEMLEPIYEAAAGPKSKVIVEGAGHGESEKVDPVLYWQSIWKFVENFIK